MNEKNLQFILDNEIVKRAIMIADEAQQTLLIVGSPDTQGVEIAENIISIDRLKGHEIKFITFWQPCPCGYYAHHDKGCICTASQIAKHIAQKPKTDLEVEIRPPSFETVYKLMKLKDIDSRLALKKYYPELGYQGILSVIKTAKAIAKLANTTNIRYQDICEALSYRVRSDQ